MPTLPISALERKTLKARAHSLKAVVLIGNAGLSAPVLQEIDRALSSHELIKVRVDGADRHARDACALAICERLSAATVQVIGRILVLYRPKPAQEIAPAPTTSTRARFRPGADRRPPHRRSVRAQTRLGADRKPCPATRPPRKAMRKGSIKGIVPTTAADRLAPAPAAPRTRLSQRSAPTEQARSPSPPARTGARQTQRAPAKGRGRVGGKGGARGRG